MEVSNRQKFIAASVVGVVFILLIGVWYFVILSLGLAYGWALGSGRFSEWLNEPFKPKPIEGKKDESA